MVSQLNCDVDKMNQVCLRKISYTIDFVQWNRSLNGIEIEVNLILPWIETFLRSRKLHIVSIFSHCKPESKFVNWPTWVKFLYCLYPTREDDHRPIIGIGSESIMLYPRTIEEWKRYYAIPVTSTWQPRTGCGQWFLLSLLTVERKTRKNKAF